MISTNRLEIKTWLTEQAADFFELTQDDGFNLYPITVYRQLDVDAARRWIAAAIEQHHRTRMGKWAVWEKSTGVLIGLGGLTPWQYEGEELVDITYRLRTSAWGKGYGTELAGALRDYAFGELGLPEITATVTPDNQASKKVLERLGMTFDRRMTLLGVETDLFRLAGPSAEPTRSSTGR